MSTSIKKSFLEVFNFQGTHLVRLSVSTIFLIGVLVVKFGFHEMWKDEWQAWKLSKDLGLIELISFLYYEGHPSLWYIFIRPFTLLPGAESIWLNIAHSLGVFAVVFILSRSRLPLSVLVLSLMSYFIFFEYGVINRGYILTIFVALLLANKNQFLKDNWFTAILLFLLCQTEFQGVLIAAAFVLASIFKYELNFQNFKKLTFRITSAVFGLVVFVLTVYPRKDMQELQFAYQATPGELDYWLKIIQGLLANVFAIGAIGDTNVFGVTGLGLLCSFITVAMLFFLLRNWNLPKIFFASYLLLTFVFHLFFYPGGVRQWGIIFIGFVITLLIQSNSKTFKGWEMGMIISLMIFPALYGFKAISKEIKYPFSNAKAAGEFIRQKVPVEVPIVAINKFETVPVAAYSERPFYSLPEGEPFTFFRWVEKIYLPPQNELQLFADFKKVNGIVIVSPRPLDKNRFPDIKEWKRFERYNLKKENYFVYTFATQ